MEYARTKLKTIRELFSLAKTLFKLKKSFFIIYIIA
jgi:hypothetical protein